MRSLGKSSVDAGAVQTDTCAVDVFGGDVVTNNWEVEDVCNR